METKIMKIKNVNGNYYYHNNEDYEMIKSIWVDFELDVFMLNTEHWIYNIDTNSKNGKYIQIYFDIDLNELYKKISYCSLIKLNI